MSKTKPIFMMLLPSLAKASGAVSWPSRFSGSGITDSISSRTFLLPWWTSYLTMYRQLAFTT